MLRLAADENLNAQILRGIRRLAPHIDIITVQDAGLSGADDASVLEWAAGDGRILITHDVSTITRWAYQRLADDKPMPGVIEVGYGLPVRVAIDDLVLLAQAGVVADIDGLVLYLPL